MAQYLSRYISGYADVTTSLRFLTKQDTTWNWTEAEQESFNKLKRALTGDQVMSYFDPQKPTQIIMDASPVGLDGLLMQDGKIISYASRALTEP